MTARFNRLTATLLTSSLFCLAAAGPVLALDAEAFVKRLETLYERQGADDALDLQYDKVSLQGENGVVLSGVSVKSGDLEPVAVGDVVFSEVSEAEDGGYTAAKGTFENIEGTFGKTRLLVDNIEISALTLPGKSQPAPWADLVYYEGLRAGPVTVERDGDPVFTAPEMSVSLSPFGQGTTIEFSTSIEDMAIDLAALADQPEGRKTIEDLGWQTLKARAISSGSWNMSDGRIVVDESTFTIDGLGSFDLTSDISGYTSQFVRDLQKSQTGITEENKQAKQIAMLGLMQELVFHSATIRIEDEAMVRPILKQMAERRETTVDKLINQTTAVLPFMLAPLKNPGFQTSVTNAVSAFLKDPQSLEIALNPTSPIPFAQIISTGATAPGTMPELLGVDIKANQ